MTILDAPGTYDRGSAGRALLDAGNPEGALPHLAAAHAEAPGASSAYYLGVALAQAGRDAEAMTAYRQALVFDRRFLEARVNLGNILRTSGTLGEARHHHLLAYAQAADHPVVQGNLVQTLAASGWKLEARHVAARMADRNRAEIPLSARAIERDFPSAAYHVALAYAPDAALAWTGLGQAEAALGNYELAWDAFAAATDHDAALVEAWSELDAVSRRLGRRQMALNALNRLLELLPGHVQVLNNLGAALLAGRQYREALVHLEAAADREPDNTMVLANLMTAHGGLRDHAKALSTGLKLAEKAPVDAALLTSLINAAQHQFDWSPLPQLQETFLRCAALGDTSPNPFSLVAIRGVNPAYQQACAAEFARQLAGEPKPAAPFVRRPGRLRIGYVSGEFREHATAFLMAEIIERHDRSRFEIVGFSTFEDPAPGPTRQRLARAFDAMVDISGDSDDEAAATVAARGIDLLIDLNGYTGTMRPGLFARRPAPVQVNYLGYPGTLGTSSMDYIIADPVVIPPEAERFYTERVARMPHCYQPNDRNRPLPGRPRRADVGLPDDAVVFCSFNACYKLTPDVFDIWCALLRTVEGSVLWVLCGSSQAGENLRREAAARGVDPARILFAPPLDLAAHLARFRCADLFLDSFPCTGHTTVSDALWAGVPVVTRIGETFASRVAGSILRAARLPQLVAGDADSYYEIAHRLATHPGELRLLKDELEHNRLTCPLFDSEAYTRDLEHLFAAMASPL